MSSLAKIIYREKEGIRFRKRDNEGRRYKTYFCSRFPRRVQGRTQQEEFSCMLRTSRRPCGISESRFTSKHLVEYLKVGLYSDTLWNT